MTTERLDISVMICTWNNAARLSVTLDAIRRCAVPAGVRWELIVVNNNCTDDTEAVLAVAAGTLPLVTVRERRQGLSHARNAGIATATGRLLVFTDDDVRPEPGWLAAYWDAYRTCPDERYFGGPVVSEFEGPRPDPDLLELAPPSVRGLDLGAHPCAPPTAVHFIGPNWACSARDVARVGGFDTRLGLNAGGGRVRTGEETDLMLRLEGIGRRAWYVPGARLHHFVPTSKCTLRHVGDRAQAYAHYRVVKGIAMPGVPGTGVPRWLYREAATGWMRWIGAKARGRKGLVEYVELRRTLGQIQAARDLTGHAASRAEGAGRREPAIPTDDRAP